MLNVFEVNEDKNIWYKTVKEGRKETRWQKKKQNKSVQRLCDIIKCNFHNVFILFANTHIYTDTYIKYLNIAHISFVQCFTQIKRPHK